MSSSIEAAYVERTVALIDELGGFELLPDAVRLLSEGRPVELERLATDVGRPVAEIDAALHDAGGPEWDERGRLVGLGLTLRPTRLRVRIADRELFAWCASDTLMFPVILGRRVDVESNCPATGRAIHVELCPDGVGRVEPRATVVSSVRPVGVVADVRAAVCEYGHFFASAAAASTWAAEHPGGYVRPVLEAFALDRQIIERLGWAAPDGR